jgi:cellulose synthase/poly-beta-1,6-N-acetylglucosamine synthase-like glycosyltransferase
MISSLWSAASLAACVLTLPGTLELLLLTAGALLPSSRPGERIGPRRKVAAVVPAHNESAGIARCIASLQGCPVGGREVVVAVIADNCTDNTAETAAAAGARTIERRDPEHRGKGYALAYAFDLLADEGFDTFLIVDADSVVAPSFIDAMCRELEAGADAVQCRYLVANPSTSLRTRIMNLALLAFNVLRPAARSRWGLSAGILGNGFGLNAATLADVPYNARSVVEDLEYHLNLIRAHKTVRFVDGTSVSGEMPTAGAGVGTQRTRWEGGRFRMIATVAPRLALGMWRRPRLVEPLLELLLLPLALHVFLLLAALTGPSAVASACGAIGLVTVGAHVVAAVHVGGGGWRDLAVLAAAPFYIVWKLCLLPATLRSSRRDSSWIRTERQAERKAGS